MTKKDELLEKIRKIKELAERGVDGEKETAQKLLVELMKKYNISDEDLEEDKNLMRFYFLDRFSYEKAKSLFVQIYVKVTGRKDILFIDNRLKLKDLRDYIKINRIKANFMLKCTDYEFLEIISKYEFYLRIYEHQEDLFYWAFLERNSLTVNEDNCDKKELTQKESQDINKILAYYAVIDKSCFPKQIKGADI